MTGFQRFQPGADAAAVIAAIERDGAAILEHAISAADLAQLRRDCDELLNATAKSEGYFHGYETKRVGAMVGKSKPCETMALHPTVLAVMDHFLLTHCSGYQINLAQLIAIGPAERRQVTHADDSMFPFVNASFQAMLNVMWAVDDFTAANGATQLVPGSHKWPRERRAAETETIAAEMPRGSCLIYLGSTRHGGGANVAAEPRRGLVISYCLGWLRQSENQYLAVPREVAQAMPERLQRLLGYFVHLPNLGMVEGRDPIELLQGKGPAALTGGFKDFLPERMRHALKSYYEGKPAAGR
jgi:hypothetical protein